MQSCFGCKGTFDGHNGRLYCSPVCKRKYHNKKNYDKKHNGAPYSEFRQAECPNCKAVFVTKYPNKNQCSEKCTRAISKAQEMARSLVQRATHGTLNEMRCNTHRGYYTLSEIAALRASPHCVLPNRSLRSQWDKCIQLGIPRDRSLLDTYWLTPEVKSRVKSPLNPALRKARQDRQYFRRRVRSNAERFLAELRLLARGHPYAEDVVVEGYAIMLRDCTPVAEAFKIARAEVNRTSAQPFREQSFNPDIDYEARETGRQVARASDIRAAGGDG